MIIIPLLLLLIPGLVSIRIHWKKCDFSVSNCKFIICDYLIYTFVIMSLLCALIFISDKLRADSPEIRMMMEPATYTTSFVFKWSFIALFLSVVLPCIVKIYKVYSYIRRSDRSDSEIIKIAKSIFFNTEAKDDEEPLL
jgi:hypothetical protein